MLGAHQVVAQRCMKMNLISSSLSFLVLGGDFIFIPLLPLFGVIQLNRAACEYKTSFVTETEEQLLVQTGRLVAFTGKLNMDFPPDHICGSI